MHENSEKKYFQWSIAAHAAILLVLTLNFYFTSPTPVIENTNKNDIISAVVLGDTAKSKILPQKQPTPPPQPIKEEVKETPKETPKEKPKVVPKEPPKEAPPPPVKQKAVQQAQAKPDAIPLKKADNKKKLAEQKALEEKKRRDKLAKDLLAELENANKKIKKPDPKKPDPKKMKAQFEKTLREQAEKSLRQQLLDEEIKLQGQQSRQSQGEVNKYKALIIQAISENWIVPPQANKTLYCELMIRIAPGGMVLDVQVTKSSGDPSLDSSARAAVLKSSPLPVPKDAEAFESFRQFVLKVKPENVMQV